MVENAYEGKWMELHDEVQLLAQFPYIYIYKSWGSAAREK